VMTKQKERVRNSPGAKGGAVRRRRGVIPGLAMKKKVRLRVQKKAAGSRGISPTFKARETNRRTALKPTCFCGSQEKGRRKAVHDGEAIMFEKED